MVALDAHILEFDKLCMELKSAEAKANDIDFVCNLLMTLPASFRPLITALETMDNTYLTLDFLKGKLIDEALKRENKKSDLLFCLHFFL